MSSSEHTAEGGFAGDDRASELFDLLGGLIVARDRAAAVAAATVAVREGRVSIDELYDDVLAPLLAGIGGRWQKGELHVWEEHLASAAVRTIVEGLHPDVQQARASWPPIGRSVVLACPPEEAHDLGLRMLADHFEMAGWTAYFLGPDTPVTEIIQAVRDVEADVLCISVSTHFHRVSLRDIYDTLRAQLPDVTVAVGGPAVAREPEGWGADEVVDVERLLEAGGDA